MSGSFCRCTANNRFVEIYQTCNPPEFFTKCYDVSCLAAASCPCRPAYKVGQIRRNLPGIVELVAETRFNFILVGKRRPRIPDFAQSNRPQSLLAAAIDVVVAVVVVVAAVVVVVVAVESLRGFVDVRVGILNSVKDS